MKSRKTDKYKNYGPIPQNEYTAANSGKSTGAATGLGVDPQEGDMAYGQRLMKRQAQPPSGRRVIRGWSRSWKANGWRAESAALHDEFMHMGRYPGYAWKGSRLI